MSGFNFNNGVVKIIDCKYGTFMHYVNDSPIGECLDVYGEWGEKEIELINQFLTPTSNVIDIGANIGTHTVFFSKKCNKGFVYGIEPQFYIFQILNANIALNGCFNTKLYNTPISNEFESVKLLHLPPFGGKKINFGEFKIHDVENGLETKCIKIDGNFSNIQFIKIDVEGHELSVLKSGDNLLKSDKPHLYVEFNNKDGNPEMLDYLMQHGYNCYWHVTEKFSYPNFRNQNTNIWITDPNVKPTFALVEKFYEGNIVCVHQSHKIDVDLEKISDIKDNYIDYLIRHKKVFDEPEDREG